METIDNVEIKTVICCEYTGNTVDITDGNLVI